MPSPSPPMSMPVSMPGVERSERQDGEILTAKWRFHGKISHKSRF
jgi:hypothetical protein